MKNKILIADDDDKIRLLLKKLVENIGHETSEASSGRQVLDCFESARPDALLLDLHMPGLDGMEVLRELKKKDKDIPVIIVTGDSDVQTVVEAMKLGAYDYIDKTKLERLPDVLMRSLDKVILSREVRRLNSQIETSLESSLGRSPSMKPVIELVRRVATCDLSVIIQGETGTGKTVLARQLHDMGPRAQKQFIAVDISSIPDTLVESELFGYEKGAFTGADKRKPGFFEAANHGTILIEELQNLSPHAQSNLLGILSEKQIYPIGNSCPLNIDIRVIAASNRDIKQSVIDGKFREDLFYRLSEFIITLPPLRERKEDIIFYAEHFLIETAGELKKNIKGISREAAQMLISHHWHGNIRELRNVIRRAVVLCDQDELSREHLSFSITFPEKTSGGSVLVPLKDIVAETEKKTVASALKLMNGNKKKVSEALQIDYKTLQKKIKDYNL